MRLFSALAALLVCGLASGLATAQTVPPRGGDDTFDVASWNIENFGEGPTVQINNAAAVIRQADIDLWALQEISDVADFFSLVQALQPDGYAGILGPQPRLGGDQRLAFIYKPAVVEVLQTTTILGAYEYEFAYRYPFEMTANVTINGVTEQMQLIDVHAKCCGDSESYNRRVAAANALKDYTDQLQANGRPVMVLGDLNDRLTLSIAGGLSPYRPFATDPNYEFATRELDRLSIPTFCSNSSCSSGSTLDHIFFTDVIDAFYVEDSGDRYAELISAIPSYTSSTSDHLPVLARFSLGATDAEGGPERDAVALLPAAPNPFRASTQLRFRLAEPGPAALTVTDALGRRVAHVAGTYAAGEHAVPFAGATLAPGLYRVRLEAAGQTRTAPLTLAR